MKPALALFLAAFCLPAAAQQRLPAAEQHVTAPAALGQANKEIVASPSDTLRQASCGRVLQGEPAPRRAPALVRAGAQPEAAGSGEGSSVSPPPALFPTSGEPTGPAFVDTAYLTLRGTLAAYEKGLVTIVDRSGRSRTVPLGRGARVDDGLKAGDAVAVRIPLEDDPANKAASRVERQKPPAPAPMSSRSSKFAQAQATAN
jgi:hypothetical protein